MRLVRWLALGLVATAPAVARMSESTLVDFRKLRRAVLDSGVRSPRAFLDLLPEVYLHGFSALYRSRGGHGEGVSARSPRVVLHGLPGTLSGDGDVYVALQPGQSTIELIYFDAERAVFSPHTVEFRRDGVRFDTELETCIGCHVGRRGEGYDFRKRDPRAIRPNWHYYFRWPGAFGSVHDNDSEGVAWRVRRMEQRWLDEARGNPLFRALPTDRWTLEALGEANIALGKKIAARNAIRVRRILEARPAYASHVPPLLFALTHGNPRLGLSSNAVALLEGIRPLLPASVDFDRFAGRTQTILRHTQWATDRRVRDHLLEGYRRLGAAPEQFEGGIFDAYQHSDGNALAHAVMESVLGEDAPLLESFHYAFGGTVGDEAGLFAGYADGYGSAMTPLLGEVFRGLSATERRRLAPLYWREPAKYFSVGTGARVEAASVLDRSNFYYPRVSPSSKNDVATLSRVLRSRAFSAASCRAVLASE